MKPLMLHGHERSVTQIKYNREGDLLFSCSKDTEPNVWWSLNGERLGTFKGHTGACWCIDVKWDTSSVITGSADNTVRVWDCKTGACLHKVDVNTAVRSCGFSYSGNLIMYSTDKTMGKECTINLYDLRDAAQMKNNEPLLTMLVSGSKVTSAIWASMDETIVSGHENGDVCKWDIKTGSIVKTVREHSKNVVDLQMNEDQSMFITASKDNHAKLFDLATLDLLKSYKTERPVNSASISPIKPHVVLGGGQEAMDVTTTSTRHGKFDARLYHMVFEEEFARVKGHFGPINSLAFNPDGKSYSSGGEDGYIRVNTFDPHYFEFEFEF
ncbi:PREDICTED: eukaryotic translation initiation factor 3 subunit I-like [Priapulus caudatus]|uniref:Eukaryotic translation initiation factor 3 subunit I n=1 Tax=Priapulus caudatus TaxID=37621 RepID=A0ABM1DZ15_PRICU|nr:PREDICTED: eukaryotic translation initiation factor 3 subunit I-like [Priapulus caudatus]